MHSNVRCLNTWFTLQHWVTRGFAAVHLVLMYAAVLSWLPGLPPALHPPATKAGLQMAGLWHPNLANSLLPVLLLLVLVQPLHCFDRCLSWMQLSTKACLQSIVVPVNSQPVYIDDDLILHNVCQTLF